MTDETAQEILNGNHTGLTGNMREDDLICMAKLWLMRKEIIEELEADTEAYGHYYLAPPDRQAFAAKIKALEAEC